VNLIERIYVVTVLRNIIRLARDIAPLLRKSSNADAQAITNALATIQQMATKYRPAGMKETTK